MEKKIGIMQPYLFPYLGYWQLLNAVDEYVVLDDVNYIKGGWINRNNILLNNNKFLITLPLENNSPFHCINEVKVTTDFHYRKKFLKTIKSAYIKAPYFEMVYPLVESIIYYNSTNIAETIYKSFEVVLSYLGIQKKIEYSSSIEIDNTLTGQNRVIDIVLRLKGTHYYNAIGGMQLYDRDFFTANNIQLNFLQTQFVPYKQFTDDFVTHLSIIDILMFNSVDAVKKMLVQFTLI